MYAAFACVHILHSTLVDGRSMAMADQNSTRSEAVLGQKWDRCLSDTLIKIGGGVGLGVIFSVFLFKRRPWPIAFGSGVGLGMGYANCQHDFSDPFKIHGKIVKVLPEVVKAEPADTQPSTDASLS